MFNSLSRRAFIQASLASSMLMSSWVVRAASQINTPVIKQTFTHGIASGDPTADSIILWTRITPIDDQSKKESINWEISEDIDFKKRVTHGKTTTTADKNFTVKVDVQNLKPGNHYFYRFYYNGVHSETGRTRTLPIGSIQSLCLAIASCSNYPFGFFNAYEVIAKDPDIDFVLHLGDYIYEYGHDGFGNNIGEKINRQHHPAHEIISLNDYRLRHAQYKSDSASRLMHAAHPIITTWDDHESANNPYLQGAQNHQTNTEGSWSERRKASTQAYYEWMPVREPESSKNRRQLWRAFEFGDLATLITLETRHTGRDKQIDYADHLSKINNDNDRSAFINNVLNHNDRKMLSKEMESFLNTQLRRSKQQNKPWRLIGNQIPMARTFTPDVRNVINKTGINPNSPIWPVVQQFMRLGELNLPLYLDTWDGYPNARERFYNISKQHDIHDLLVLTGDSHSFWANEIRDNKGKKIGLELGTAGITSPGDFETFGEQGAASIDQLLAAHNREVKWTNCQHRGFIKLTLEKTQATAKYVVVDTVLKENYQSSILKTFNIVKEKNTLEYLK